MVEDLRRDIRSLWGVVNRLQADVSKLGLRVGEVEKLEATVNELEIARRVSAQVTSTLRAQGQAQFSRREKLIAMVTALVVAGASLAQLIHGWVG